MLQSCTRQSSVCAIRTLYGVTITANQVEVASLKISMYAHQYKAVTPGRDQTMQWEMIVQECIMMKGQTAHCCTCTVRKFLTA